MPSIRGTASVSDGRALNKALRGTRFPASFSKKLHVSKINRAVVSQWIEQKIAGLLGFEDEIVQSTAVNLFLPTPLEDGPPVEVDPRKAQIDLAGFLGDAEAAKFCSELWEMLLDAQDSSSGIPKKLVEEKKKELAMSQQPHHHPQGGPHPPQASSHHRQGGNGHRYGADRGGPAGGPPQFGNAHERRRSRDRGDYPPGEGDMGRHRPNNRFRSAGARSVSPPSSREEERGRAGPHGGGAPPAIDEYGRSYRPQNSYNSDNGRGNPPPRGPPPPPPPRYYDDRPDPYYSRRPNWRGDDHYHEPPSRYGNDRRGGDWAGNNRPPPRSFREDPPYRAAPRNRGRESYSDEEEDRHHRRRRSRSLERNHHRRSSPSPSSGSSVSSRSRSPSRSPPRRRPSRSFSRSSSRSRSRSRSPPPARSFRS